MTRLSQLPHHDGSALYVSNPVPDLGDTVTVFLRAPHAAGVGSAYLRVDVVYLTPVFPARSNHRYDAATFDVVDPLLGGDEALRRLAGAVHRRGMRLLADLTTNHSGNSHQWFVTARDDPASLEAQFFLFRQHPDDYESWLGVRTLPKFDHRSPELRRRLYEGSDSVVARWLRPPFNLDGWRIDVANMTGRYAVTDVNHLVATTIRATMAQVRRTRCSSPSTATTPAATCWAPAGTAP